jgi:hypothetical protein
MRFGNVGFIWPDHIGMMEFGEVEGWGQPQ